MTRVKETARGKKALGSKKATAAKAASATTGVKRAHRWPPGTQTPGDITLRWNDSTLFPASVYPMDVAIGPDHERSLPVARSSAANTQ
jgi:hypothetical protein